MLGLLSYLLFPRVSTVLLRLSPVHYNVLVFLIAFMKEALKHGARNGLTEPIVARVCSLAIMRKEEPSTSEPPPEAAASSSAASSDELPGVWRPTGVEQEAMDSIVLHLLRSADT